MKLIAVIYDTKEAKTIIFADELVNGLPSLPVTTEKSTVSIRGFSN